MASGGICRAYALRLKALEVGKAGNSPSHTKTDSRWLLCSVGAVSDTTLCFSGLSGLQRHSKPSTLNRMGLLVSSGLNVVDVCLCAFGAR